MTIPLMGRDPVKPAASLRVGVFRVGSQAHGFLTIGALPVLIATDAEVAFSSLPADSSALADLVPALVSLAKTRAVEIRHFSLILPGASQPLLTAARATPAGGGQWNLSEVSIAGEHSVKAAKARLSTAGSTSGQITFEREGVTETLRLLSPASSFSMQNPTTEHPNE